MDISPMTVGIIGPTAIGKSDLAHQLAQKISAEIISMDSVQVYRGMNIGSDKPSPSRRQQVNYHLLDLIDFWQVFNVRQYVDLCSQKVVEIKHKKRPVIICGGSMMYFRLLTQGVSDLPSAKSDLRYQLEQDYQANPQQVYEKLNQLDPQTAQRLHQNDRQRIIRALEVNLISGKTLKQAKPATHAVEIDFLIVLQAEQRQQLHQAITHRWQRMLDEGFLAEVKSLYEHPKANPRLASMQSVGYKQLWQYLDNKIDFQQACQDGQTATRRLAKKQSTWIRSLTKDRPPNICLQYQEVVDLKNLCEQLQQIKPSP